MVTAHGIFSTAFAAAEADALLCEWDVSDELFTFPGAAAWYTAEPRENPHFGVQMRSYWMDAITRARPGQLLYPAHPDQQYRVPHVTHGLVDGRPARSYYDGPRRPKAAAVIGNAGGQRSDWWPEIELRNRFVSDRGVDVYGPRWLWGQFRPQLFFRNRAVPGYQGEAEEVYLGRGIGDRIPRSSWPVNTVKVGLLSRYHAAICLENSVEPEYFSEKFVDGVLACCVPIYRAHPTVRDGILRGARWVDPADFGMSVRRTLTFALKLNRQEVAEQNRAWFESEAVQASEQTRVWTRIAQILKNQPSQATRR